MFTCFPANLSAFLMCYRKKITIKIIHIPQAFCSVSANNGELVLSSSPKTLYMRHLGLFFLTFSWGQSVVSSHCKLAPAQECSMGLCMFRWNILQCALLCLCVWVSVCQGRKRGAGHSERASWHLPNTIWILNAGRYANVAVDTALSLSLTLHRLATCRLQINDGYWIPLYCVVIQCCTCLLYISSLHWS